MPCSLIKKRAYDDFEKYYRILNQNSTQRDLYRFNMKKKRKPLFSTISREDNLAILLLRATVLTVDSSSWQTLHNHYQNNMRPVKIIIVETERTKLVRTEFFTDIEGGYFAFEFILSEIDRFISDSDHVSEPYQELLRVWSAAFAWRRDTRISCSKRALIEGDGRTVRLPLRRSEAGPWQNVK